MSTKSRELADLVATRLQNAPLREVLGEDVGALRGIGDGATAALALVDVATVFDLATSGLFDDATRLVIGPDEVHSLLAQHRVPPSDLLKSTRIAGVEIEQIQYLDLNVLHRLSDPTAKKLQDALGVETVRDLALYPPYLAARELLTALYFPENASGFDPERPVDLLPATGDYPTERVQYTTLLIDDIPAPDGVDLVDVNSAEFAPLDLASLAKGDAGFQKVAFGALLTFNQSWYAQGVTLGQLLHSTSLAPGESTRIAVVDWSRRSRAGQTETISEVDDLANDTTHNRSISEVTRAVAKEAQSGFSSTNSGSESSQAGVSSAMEMSAPLGGLLGGPSGSMGTTASEASTEAWADSFSTSHGRRDISSRMAQQVNDRTHQHAHSARNRRASVVKEVSQSEHDEVSTRVIANYNHMHALTIQYYEVVQIYRTDVSVKSADRVVFIPLRLIDFNNDELVRRFRSTISRVALSREMRQAIENLDVIELTPSPTTPLLALGSTTLDRFLELATSHQLKPLVVEPTPHVVADAEVKPTVVPTTAEIVSIVSTPNVLGAQKLLNLKAQLWRPEQASRLSGLLNRSVLRRTSASLFLPADVIVDAAEVESGDTVLQVSLKRSDGTTADIEGAGAAVPLSQVTSILLRGSNADHDVTAEVTLTLDRNGVRFPVELPAVTVIKGTSSTELVKVAAGGINANLRQHLMDHQAHYSRAIFRALDATQIAWLLSGFGIDVDGTVVPVSQVVEPNPIRYVGNYLAFRMNTSPSMKVGGNEWSKWLDDHGVKIGAIEQDIVPLPSGGTFAEAVLGRSNSAEKLDLTRFWNWQDSPPPMQATDIAAISLGSRAQAENVTPGQLSAPIVNITSPTALPDPAGTAAILAAIQNGNMFRDMSGLKETVALATAALQATSAGAATAGQQAGENMNNLLKANTERQKAAAEMITSLADTAASMYTGGAAGGKGGSTGGGSGSHSEDGAKINYFDSTRGSGSGTSGSGGGGGGGGGGGVPAGTTPADGGGDPGPTMNGGSGGGSGGSYSDNPAALAATWGDSQPRSDFISGMVDRLGDTSILGTDAPTSPLTTRKAWPHLDPTRVLDRIAVLEADADRFDQGALGLCTAAAFYHHMIQRDAARFGAFARALYGAGQGRLGSLRVAPGSDLRNVDYAALAARTASLPAQADWMLMSSLRDSENWFFDYEGSTDESVAISTSADELSSWYEDTKLYTKVDFVTNTSLTGIKALEKKATNHVALWIKTSLIQETSDGTHMITLESQPVIDEPADTITFRYWTWGEAISADKTFELSTFERDYLGAIVAEF